MGKQTFVLLRCRECGLFQNHIERRDAKFSCVCCATKQAYERVFAKSNLAKDLRSLAAEYNMKGVAAMEAAKDDLADDRADDHADPVGELRQQQLEADSGPIGGAWEEFGDEEGQEIHDTCDVERRSALTSAVCSDWARDSDARRIEEQQARFAKKPRIDRNGAYRRGRPDVTVFASRGGMDIEETGSGGDVFRSDVRGGARRGTDPPLRQTTREVEEKIPTLDHVQNQSPNCRNAKTATDWDAYLSDA